MQKKEDFELKKLFKNTLVVIGVFVVVYTLLYLFVDKPVALWMHGFAGTLLFATGKALSHLASGVFTTTWITTCLVLVLVHDVFYGQTKWSKTLLLVCVSVAVAEVIGDCLKFFLGRYRPVMFFEKGLYGFHFFGSEWAQRSTPSGHTIRIFSSMMVLAVAYRKYALASLGFALLVGLSRVVVTAHYPSDVLFGSVVGSLTALWVCQYGNLQAEK